MRRSDFIFEENSRIRDLESSESLNLESESEQTADEESSDIQWTIPDRASSFVWKTFKLDPARKGYAICRWEFEDGTICGAKIRYSKGGSTGGLGTHVRKHEEGSITQAQAVNIPKFFQSSIKKRQDMNFVLWLITSNRPFHLAKDEELPDFLFSLNHKYQIPSEPTMSKYRDFIYTLVQEKSVFKIRQHLSLHLTMDSWTKYNNYVGVMAHCMTTEWKIETFLIRLEDSGYISETHEYLATVFNNATEKILEGSERKVHVTVDGGTNYIKMTQEHPKIVALRCSSHIMQNVVITTFSLCQYALGIRSKCNDVVSHFNMAKKSYEAFRIHQAVKGTPQNKFVTRGDTRWYSDHMMLQSVLVQIPALEVFPLVDFTLDLEEQHSLQVLVDFLGYVRNKFQTMERQDEPTISRVLVAIDQIERKIDEYLSQPDLGDLWSFFHTFGEQMKSKFRNIIESSNVHDAGTFLDIRFKKIQRLEQFRELCESILGPSTVVTKISDDHAVKKRKIEQDTTLQELIDNEPVNALDQEIEDFFTLVQPNPTADPLEYWKTVQGISHRFPALQKVASQILAIPATSSSSERLFSDGGNILSPKRNGLLPANLEKHLLIKKNWKSIKQFVQSDLEINIDAPNV